MSNYDGTFKILLLRDPEVDISGFIPQPGERLTIGVEFMVKTLVVDDKMYKLQLWDLVGGKRLRFLLPTYCSGAKGAVLLYDIAKPQTLYNIGEWVNNARHKSGDLPIMLVGIMPNKKKKRQVSAQEGKDIATSSNLNGFMEINARTGKNVGKAYETIIRLILANEEYQTPIKMKKYEEFIVYDLKNTGDTTKLNINMKQHHLRKKAIEMMMAMIDSHKEKSDRDDDGDDRYPYPYIFKPPEPPEDLTVAPLTQLRSSPRKKEPEEEIYCQYCGKKLAKEEQITHSCKKKPEKNSS